MALAIAGQTFRNVPAAIDDQPNAGDLNIGTSILRHFVITADFKGRVFVARRRTLMADFDLFVIGAGSGGVRAARIAAATARKVAIAEEYRVGGTCVIRGCVPKKLLVYGAHFAEDLDDAAMFGWDVPQKRFDWPVLRDNVLAEVAGSRAPTPRR